VWAKPTNTFRLHNLTIAKQPAVWRLEYNCVRLLREQQKNTLPFHGQRNALTVFLAFPVTKAIACFNKLSFSTQTTTLFAPEELLYRMIFMGAAQTRKPLKRLDLNFLII